MQPTAIQRIRIRFRKFGPTRFISHLDIARTWERALNRSKIPVAYTQGFNRRPRLQFATATPLGTTSDWEFIDVWLKEIVSPAQVMRDLAAKMAPGIEVVEATEVELSETALQNQTRETTYRVFFLDPLAPEVVERLRQGVAALLAAEEVIRERTVKKKRKRYDLRPLIYDLALSDQENGDRGKTTVLDMRLALEPSKTGRPDEVLKSLDVDPLDCHVHRTGITFQI